MLRVGIVGCGSIGRKHAEVYADLGHRVVAAADPVGRAAEELARAAGAGAYTDVAAMLAAHPLDLVSICSPPAARLPAIEAAAARGCHVFCEKPMALTLADARRIERACREAKVALGFGFKMRYEAPFLALKRAIESGRIGQPSLAYFTYFQQKPRIPWYLEIGALRDTLVHTIDLAFWFLEQEPERVEARLARRFNPRAEDLAHLRIEFPRGEAYIAGGYFEDFPPVGGSHDLCFQVVGTRGYGAGKRPNRLVLTTAAGVDEQGLTVLDGFRGEIAAFLRALETDPGSIPVSGRDGLRSQAVIEAAYASADAGRAVAVPPLS